jgi:hypothetical protein
LNSLASPNHLIFCDCFDKNFFCLQFNQFFPVLNSKSLRRILASSGLTSAKMDDMSEKEAHIVLYLISKKTDLKNFLDKHGKWPDSTLQRCVQQVLADGDHVYGDGLTFVDQSEELEAATEFVKLAINKGLDNLEVNDSFPQVTNQFLGSYIAELKREQELNRGLQAISVEITPGKFIEDFGLMTHLLGHLGSGQFSDEVLRNLLKLNIGAVESILPPTNPHIAKVHEEYLLLDKLMVVKLWLELAHNENPKTEETLNRLKAALKSVKELSHYNKVANILFELLFLQSEDLRTDGTSGFVCQKSGVEQMLNFLKVNQQQKVHSKEFSAADEAERGQFNEQFERVKTALWLLSLFEDRPQQQLERAKVGLKASSLFNPLKPPHTSSDDEDTKAVASKKYSTYPRKKAPKKRVQHKSDGTGSGTAAHPQAGSSSFPNCEDEQLMQQSNANVIAKMLASPEVLVAVCMYNNDLGSVAAVIKVRGPEKSQAEIQENLSFPGIQLGSISSQQESSVLRGLHRHQVHTSVNNRKVRGGETAAHAGIDDFPTGQSDRFGL